MNSGLEYILVIFLTIGMSFPLWWIYKYCRKNFSKKHPEIDEGEKYSFFFFIGFAILLLNLLWFVPQVITGDVVNNVVDAQRTNCHESYTEDGKEFTDKQCEFFQDVLNGKYIEYEQDFNINEFIDQ